MKPSFLNQPKPLLVAMIQEETAGDLMREITNAIYSGADALGIQLEYLLPEHRDEEVLRRAFSCAGNRPIYVTAYKSMRCQELNDDELGEILLTALRAGATLIDVRADMFCPNEDQLTLEGLAIRKQTDLINRIHEMGGEALMSSHLPRKLNSDESLYFAREQCSRGADVAKIVSRSESEDDEMEAINIIYRLKKELGHEFLFLVSGSHTKLVRQLGPAFGCCMYLCIERYRKNSQGLMQPRLDATRAVRDGMLL